MRIELLIEAIVRQTTILIAQLATSGGARAPLAQVAGQVFLDLVGELERQGVSRKVSADMFGLGLRTYQRKIQRFLESSTDRGRSLWVAVLDYVQHAGNATRAQVLEQFASDDDSQVRGVLRDLTESGLIATSGSGARRGYRLTSEDELQRLRQVQSNDGLDELLWALIYRQGPCSLEELQKRTPTAKSSRQRWRVSWPLVASSNLGATGRTRPAAWCCRWVLRSAGKPPFSTISRRS